MNLNLGAKFRWISGYTGTLYKHDISTKTWRTLMGPVMLSVNTKSGRKGAMLCLYTRLFVCAYSPALCMAAVALFMGEATLRKIFWRQDTLRGVTAVRESLLQPDRVLFLPSPLLSHTQTQRIRHNTDKSQNEIPHKTFHLCLENASDTTEDFNLLRILLGLFSD